MSTSPVWRALSGGALPQGSGVELDGGPRYEATSHLGRGGMGQVDAVHDRWLGREVASKISLADDPRTEALLRAEATITAKLEHPSIVPVYDMGRREDGRLFYTMRLVRGQTLEAAVSGADATPQRMGLLRHLLDACHAMAFAHGVGVVHRDLKPDNVLVGAYGETQVVDWGLAVEVPCPQEAGPVGTTRWMAPEQAKGQASPRSDVYALGRMLRYVGLSDVPELEAIIARATRDAPEARYADAGEMAADLAAFLDGRRVGAYRYGLGELLARWAAQHRLALAIASAATVALAASSWWAWSTTTEQLARSLARDAEHALARGQHPEAAVLAAASLARREGPTARGVLAGALAAGPPTLVASRPLPACTHGVVTAGPVVCFGSDGTASWLEGDGEPLRADGLALWPDGRWVGQRGSELWRHDGVDRHRVSTTTYRFRWQRWGEHGLGVTQSKLAVVRLDDGTIEEFKACPDAQGLLAVATDPSTLAAVCSRGVALHRGQRRRWLALPDSLSGSVSAARLGPDSVYVGTLGGQVVRLHRDEGTVLATTEAGIGPVAELVDAGEYLVARGHRGGLLVLHPDTLASVAVLPQGPWWGARSDGTQLEAWGERYLQWELPRAPRARRLDFPSGLSSLAITGHGAGLATAHGHGYVLHSDLRTGGIDDKRQLVDGAAVKAVAEGSDGTLFAALPHGGAVSWSPGGAVERLAGSPNARQVVSVPGGWAFLDYGGGVWLDHGPQRWFDARQMIDASSGPNGSAFLDDEGNIYRDGGGPPMRHVDGARAVGIDPHGAIAVATADTVHLGDKSWPVQHPITRLVLTPRFLIAGDRRGSVTVWARQGSAVARLEAHTDRISDLAVDGDTLWTASWDGTAQAWNLAALELTDPTKTVARAWGLTLDEVLPESR